MVAVEILQANLDYDQLECASILDRNVLILAGPGSGKTRVLVHRVAFLLRSTPSHSHKVLCLTFTVEAAKEMQRRLAGLLSRAQMNRIVVMNFHQFSVHLLRHYGHLIGIDRDFTILGTADQAELVEEVVDSLQYGRVKTSSVTDFISKRKGRREYRGELLDGLGTGSLHAIFEEYERRKADRNELDFDDLILKAVELLEQVESVRSLAQSTFPHVEVDELQDTSLLQLTLLRLLYSPTYSRVFAVADDDQMVYEWRDARPETLNEYEDWLDPHILILRVNYRCPERIVEVANAVVSNNAGRREKMLVSARTDTQGRVTLSNWASLEDQSSFIANTIYTSITEKQRSYRDHVVLARVRRTLERVQTALAEAELPSIMIGAKDVENSPLVRLLLAGLRLAARHPNATNAIQQAIVKANTKLQSEVFSAAGLQSLVERLAHEYDPVFCHALESELRVSQILGEYGEEEEFRRVERFLAMVAMSRSESAWTDYASMFRTITVEFNSLLSRVNVQYDAVRLMTVHGAKGLQFPVVFIPDVCDSAFPNLRSRNIQVNMPEERRLLFVAITRSEDEVHLSWADEGPWGYPANASPFITEILQDAVQWVEEVN